MSVTERYQAAMFFALGIPMLIALTMPLWFLIGWLTGVISFTLEPQ